MYLDEDHNDNKLHREAFRTITGFPVLLLQKGVRSRPHNASPVMAKKIISNPQKLLLEELRNFHMQGLWYEEHDADAAEKTYRSW